MEGLNIDQELVSRCNSVSQFDVGDVIAADWGKTFERFAERFGNRSGLTQEQYDYIEGRAAGWRDLCEKAVTDCLRRRADYVPWNVAGRSNYPAKKMGEKADRSLMTGIEWAAKAERYLDNTAAHVKALTPIEEVLDHIRKHGTRHGEAIASDDPYALEKLEAKLEYHRDLQERMKTENAACRKQKKSAPWAGFTLANNGATIKAIQKRIDDIKAHREAKDLKAFSFAETAAYPGGRVEPNYDIDRLMIFFDEKPDGTMRDQLHSRGFHWSRKNGAWQRQLTRNAMAAAMKLLGVSENAQS